MHKRMDRPDKFAVSVGLASPTRLSLYSEVRAKPLLQRLGDEARACAPALTGLQAARVVGAMSRLRVRRSPLYAGLAARLGEVRFELTPGNLAEAAAAFAHASEPALAAPLWRSAAAHSARSSRGAANRQLMREEPQKFLKLCGMSISPNFEEMSEMLTPTSIKRF